MIVVLPFGQRSGTLLCIVCWCVCQQSGKPEDIAATGGTDGEPLSSWPLASGHSRDTRLCDKAGHRLHPPLGMSHHLVKLAVKD